MCHFGSDSSFEENLLTEISDYPDSLDESIRSVEDAVEHVQQVVKFTNPEIGCQFPGTCNPATQSLAMGHQCLGAVRLPQTSCFNPSKYCQSQGRAPLDCFDFVPQLSPGSPHPSPELCPPPPSSRVPPPPHACIRKIIRSESCNNLMSSLTSPVHPGVNATQSTSSFDVSLHQMAAVFDKPYIALGRKLLKAAEMGKAELIRQLLDEGADPNFTFGSEWTPLHKAARKGHADVLSVLLLRGANPHARTSSGFTALHIAAYNDYCGQCITLLIDAGSDVRSTNLSGRTPLHYAAEGGNMTAVRKLLAAGANKFARNSAGQTAVDIATSEHVRRLLR